MLDYQYIVVGHGPGAFAILEEFRRQGVKEKILWIYSTKALVPCALNSTATVSLNGISKGVSPLGDLLREGLELFNEFNEEHHPFGVEKASFYYIAPTQNEKACAKLKRRFGKLGAIHHELFIKEEVGAYEEGHLIRADIYFSWWRKRIEESLSVDSLGDMVVGLFERLGDQVVQTLKKKEFRAQKVFLATGAYSLLYPLGQRALGKLIPGHYFQWNDQDLNCESFVFSRAHHKLIYRSTDQSLMLVGTSEQDELFAKRFSTLDIIYQEFEDLLSRNSKVLPPLSSAILKTGPRHKGPRRMPFYGKLDGSSNVYLMSGLYKNGFTLPFALCRELNESF